MSQNLKTLTLVHMSTVAETLEFINGQSSYMKERGFEIHAIASPSELLIQFGDREQITVHSVNMPRQITPLKDLYALFHLRQHLRQIRPQIIHAYSPKGGLLGMISAWLAGVPVRIYHIYGLPLMTAVGYKRSLLWLSEKISCLLANQVLCVSHSIREVAISENLCPQSKIKVLLKGGVTGVDAANHFNKANLGTDVRFATRKQYDIPANALVVGFVGRIVRDKGLAELVGAWKILSSEFPNLHLLVVGPFEPQDPVPEDVEYTLKNDPRIHLTGRRSHISPLYTAMDIFALPTYREGLSTVILEAAAMELPVVATRIPGCIDAMQEGVTGSLVPPHDAKALADAIRTYLQNSKLRHQHGQAGRELILRDFLPEAMCKVIYQEYIRLLTKKRLLPAMKILFE